MHPDHEANRVIWNDLAKSHVNHPDFGIARLRSGGSTLRSIERTLLGKTARQRLLHLMCQCGVDSLSLEREGAIVTGVDISDESVAIANALASELSLQTRFVQSDILALRASVTELFDLVYSAYGICHWISDLTCWAKQIAASLIPEGRLVLIDDHPFRVLQTDPPRSYFAGSAERFRNVTDFYDRSAVIKGELVQWQHSISEILQSLIDAGLRIEAVSEYGFGYYQLLPEWHLSHDGYWHPPDAVMRWPVMWSVVARKGLSLPTG